MALTPTKQQQDVLEAVRGYFQEVAMNEAAGFSGQNKLFSLFLSAVAGAGKTSTIMMIADVVAEVEHERGITVEWTALSFNKAIKNASNKKLVERGHREVAKTTNQLGRGILDEAGRAGQCRRPGRLNNYKFTDLITDYCKKHAKQIPTLPFGDPRRETEKSLNAKIKKLVSAARLTYCDCSSEEALYEIVEHYGIDINRLSPYWAFIWKAVCPVIQMGVERYQATGEHDFDDQLYLPLRLDVAAPIYDLICVDEAQDLNKVRTELVKRSIKPSGMLFFVGDRRQAIQGFAFADTASVDNIIRDTHAVEMPLTCCWRCDLNIIRLAQVINPAIEARPGAGAGIIDVVNADSYVLEPGYFHPTDKSLCKDADMVLCRVTAPLVKGCLSAIRKGVLAIVRGRSIGDSVVKKLTQILEKHPEAYDITKLSEAAWSYYHDEAMRIMTSGKRDAEEEIDKLNDQIETIDALVEGYLLTEPEDMTVNGLKAFIESKFEGEEGDQEEEQKEGPRPVVFSTVHKAKGLETDRVFILHGEKMPHPMAMKSGKAWQIEQEYNILYVAVTRAKRELYFVDYVPDSLRDMFNAIVHDELAGVEDNFFAALPEIEEEPEEEEVPVLAAQEVVEEAEEIIKQSNAGRPKTKEKLASFKLTAETISFLDSLPKGTKTQFIEELIKASAEYERWQKGQTCEHPSHCTPVR